MTNRYGEKAVVVLSGGLDSTTLLYEQMQRYPEMTTHAISFDYGQRHAKELEYAAATCASLDVQHDIVDLTGLTHLISNSALTSSNTLEVPEGHYAEENMALTIVPNRNMIMLSIAIGVAVNEGAVAVYTAVHAGDHFVYPDCRPMFLSLIDLTAIVGNDLHGAEAGFVFAPYSDMTKTDIAYNALVLNVPLDKTWSCYKGGKIHCGRCGTCVERLEAIDGAMKRLKNDVSEITGRPLTSFPHEDTTEYEDTEFWKTATSKPEGTEE